MKKNRGLTLIELVVVMAILGVLAAMMVAKFEGLQSAANHTAAASSSSDVAKLISVYKTSKNVYPDGWDSLTDGNGNLWSGTGGSGGNAGSQVKGLHNELVDASAAKLTVMSSGLVDAQVNAFKTVGITTLFNVNSASTARAGDMFLSNVTLTTGAKLAIVNSATAGGKKIINHIYRQNLRTTNATSGAINPDPNTGATDPNTQLVVVGLGPQSKLVTTGSILEAPTYGGANATYVYNRLLVVFELKNSVDTSDDGSGTTTTTITGSKVTFKAVLGSDGDLMDDMSVNMQTATSL